MENEPNLTPIIFDFTTSPLQKLVRGNQARIAKKIEHIFQVQIEKNKTSEGKTIARSWVIKGQQEDAKAARNLFIELQDKGRDILPENITAAGVNRNRFKEINQFFDNRLDELRSPENQNDNKQPDTPTKSQATPRITTSKSSFNAKSEDQEIAYAAIMTPGVSVTSLTGGPGSGKSVVAISSAFNLLQENLASKVVIVRPMFNGVNKLGAVPGELSDKMRQHIQAQSSNIKRVTGNSIEELVRQQKLEIFCYNDGEQGNTHHDAIIIIDDSQGIPASDIRTMMTRVSGNVGKVILTGDLSGGQDTVHGVSSLAQVICGFGKNIEENPRLTDKFAFVAFEPASMNTRHPDMQDIVASLDSEECIRPLAFRQSEADRHRLDSQRTNALRYMETLDSMTRAKYTPL